MEEEPDGAEETAHALFAQPFAFEVHTSASVEGEQWKQRWKQCMRDIQRGDAMCVEAMQATRTFGGDAYHLLHVNYESKADDHRGMVSQQAEQGEDVRLCSQAPAACAKLPACIAASGNVPLGTSCPAPASLRSGPLRCCE